jgi:hypothetical protein
VVPSLNRNHNLNPTLLFVAFCTAVETLHSAPSNLHSGMAYEVVPEPGEEVRYIQLDLSRKVQPFHFAVSNRAIYIPRIKLIAKTDPFYFQRVPLDQVREVAVKRLRPYALWLLAALMIPAGLLSSFFMMEGVMNGTSPTHRVTGWPIAVFVGGLLVPFVAKGRLALRIEFNDGSYRWKLPEPKERRLFND